MPLPAPGTPTAAVAGTVAPEAATAAVLPEPPGAGLLRAALDDLASGGVAEPADDAPDADTAPAAAAAAMAIESSRSNDRTKALRREKYSLA